MNEIKFNNKTNILKVTINGAYGIPEAFELYNSIRENKYYSSNLRLLIDFRNAIININFSEADNILKTVHGYPNKNDSIKKAIIIDKPYETAILMLCYKEILTDNYSCKIFCAENNALRWLLCKNEEEYIKKQLHNEPINY